MIEHITQKKLKPTYTYLSAYVHNADLPAHTDRPECEYTVSFVINKNPTDLYWPIYIDKEKQKTKNAGRSKHTPSKSNCIEIDCNVGGLMVFCGTDHIHYREVLEGEFYHTLLLHYQII